MWSAKPKGLLIVTNTCARISGSIAHDATWSNLLKNSPMTNDEIEILIESVGMFAVKAISSQDPPLALIVTYPVGVSNEYVSDLTVAANTAATRIYDETGCGIPWILVPASICIDATYSRDYKDFLNDKRISGSDN